MWDIPTKVANNGVTLAGKHLASEFNNRELELEKAVTHTGIVLTSYPGDPDATPDSNTEMLAEAISRDASLAQFGTCSGSANTYVIASNGVCVVPKARFDGMRVHTIMNATNTGASTANVFSLGAKPIVNYAGDALIGGELLIDRDVELEWSVAMDSWRILPWSQVGDIWIREDVTYTVGPASDYATIQAAFDDLRYKLIAPDATVTLALTAGQHTLTSSVVPQHLNGARIEITGAALLGAWPTDTDIVSSSTTTLATLRAKFATEIICSNCHGFEVTRGQYLKVTNILFSGSGTGYTAILAGDSLNYLGSSTDYYGPGQVTVEKCWAINFDQGWWVRQGSQFTGWYIGASHCGVGFWINNGSYAILSYCHAMRCTGIAGIYCRDRSYVEVTGMWVSNNADKGIAINEMAGCNLLGLTSWKTITANGTYGALCNQMSRASIYNITFTSNTSGPCKADTGSYINLDSTCAYSGGSNSPAVNTAGNSVSYIKN